MTDRNLTPWYGTPNMETDTAILTACGKSVEPMRMDWMDGAAVASILTPAQVAVRRRAQDRLDRIAAIEKLLQDINRNK